MRRLRQRLPPANSLVAFEAAGRLCSFTEAAAELSVTQAAVGRQVRTLEARLGAPLFDRTHRRLTLTADGQRFHEVVTRALERIAEAAAGVAARAGVPQLTMATTHAFATFWLVPRLGRFQESVPQANLRLVSSDVSVDLTAEGIDIAIQWGNGGGPGVETTKLLGEEIFPVCSPTYLAGRGRRGALRHARDLLGERLLYPSFGHPGWSGWAEWFAAAGVDPGGTGPGLHFSSYDNAIQAALDARGIVLAWRHLHDDALARGALVRPIRTVMRTSNGYYLAVPRGRPLGPLAAAFRDWLHAEIASPVRRGKSGGRISPRAARSRG